MCSTCAAYWHYECANVTEDDINKLGDKEFYCMNHKAGSKKVADCSSKVEPYLLNMKSFYKKLMKNLSSKFNCEKKDNGKQYLVTLNTTTYLIMLSKIVEMGENAGLSIKRNCDLSEKETKSQFELTVSQSGVQVPITMTWYHTTTNVMIQAKGRRKERGWTKKLNILEDFVNSTLSEMVNQVEISSGYKLIKENVHKEISKAMSRDIDNDYSLYFKSYKV